LACLRELLASELRALFVDALPAALHDLRDSLQATVDQWVAFLTDDALTRRRRRRHLKRLSRMNASSNLLGTTDDHAQASTLQGEALFPRQFLSPVRLEMDGAVDGSPAQAPADDAVYDSPGGGNASIVDDASSSASVAGSEEQDKQPPLSDGSKWHDSLPRVPGIAHEKPLPPLVGWKTINTFEALHDDSDTDSDFSSVANGEAGAPLSTIPEADETEIPVETVMPAKTEVSDEEDALGSATSSRNVLASGVSYRQLTEELTSRLNEDSEKAPPAFYRAALQKLKQERELRARLRNRAAEGVTSSSLPALASLRRMQVSPVMPENEEDPVRHMRHMKLIDLRQRTTPFAIKMGQPLNSSTSTDETRIEDGA
jgi:hypothetical protein